MQSQSNSPPNNSAYNYINEQTLLFLAIGLFVLACFRECLLRIPYLTIVSTLISACGLVAGFAAVFDATIELEHMLVDLFEKSQKSLKILNQLKVIYIAVVLSIILVIVFNLVVGYVARDKVSYYGQRRHNAAAVTAANRFCCCCLNTSARRAIRDFLMRIFFMLNYALIYALLIAVVFVCILQYTAVTVELLCFKTNETSALSNLPKTHSSRTGWEQGSREQEMDLEEVPPHLPFIDLMQFGQAMELTREDVKLMMFEGDRYERLCDYYIPKFHFLFFVSSIGLAVACLGFINYLLNFTVNTAKIYARHEESYDDKTYLDAELEQP